MSQRRERGLRRLQLELSLAWAGAWLLGVGSLLAVAISADARLSTRDLDAELALHAMAVYGLTWFDAQGTFHDEVLRRETDLMEAALDLWVVEPGAPPIVHFAPDEARFEVADLAALAEQIVGTQEAVRLDGRDAAGLAYRLHGVVTFEEETDEPRAAVFAIGDPAPRLRAHREFVREISMATLALSLIGLLLGLWLARRSLRPVLASFDQREQFLAAAAHELRTPVASLLAVSDTANSTDEAPAEALERVGRVARKMARSVEHLLLLARLDASEESLHGEQLRLDLLVEAALPEDGSVTLDATQSVVFADARLMEVVVRNLLENAEFHGRTSENAEPAKVTVRDGCIVVEDHGPGFPDELLARAAEPFAAGPSSRGSGLGLAIVRLVVELHGGRLTLENRPEGGARVAIHLENGTSARSQVDL